MIEKTIKTGEMIVKGIEGGFDSGITIFDAMAGDDLLLAFSAMENLENPKEVNMNFITIPAAW